ncbi:MAG: NAD(P)-dependent oxidoreductase [bacterium]|nr:NAD(P)-dependent oxidoreductase [bacterium]
MATRVGYIGLGDMGGAMAGNLAPKGFDTRVYDLNPVVVKEVTETGATAGTSCREIGAHAEVLSICVPADAHVEAVLLGEDGALQALAEGSIILIHSTVQPDTIERMERAAAERGVGLIDACVTGGRAVAEAGELTMLCGGKEALVERARPVLEAYGKTVLHAGPLGCGAKLKLAVNLLTYVNWAAVAESYRLAEASGLDPNVFVEAVKSNGQLSQMQQRFVLNCAMPQEAIESDDFQKFIRLQMHTAEKDLAHALELGRKSGIALPAAGLVSQEMARIYRVVDDGRR